MLASLQPAIRARGNVRSFRSRPQRMLLWESLVHKPANSHQLHLHMRPSGNPVFKPVCVMRCHARAGQAYTWLNPSRAWRRAWMSLRGTASSRSATPSRSATASSRPTCHPRTSAHHAAHCQPLESPIYRSIGKERCVKQPKLLVARGDSKVGGRLIPAAYCAASSSQFIINFPIRSAQLMGRGS